jgi:hypothetical protein
MTSTWQTTSSVICQLFLKLADIYCICFTKCYLYTIDNKECINLTNELLLKKISCSTFINNGRTIDESNAFVSRSIICSVSCCLFTFFPILFSSFLSIFFFLCKLVRANCCYYICLFGPVMIGR